ncbi:WhiB family transcriptional regulator [Streptosporangium sp. NPDC004631]
MTTPTIGELRVLRVQAGLSVWQVGEAVGASGSTVSAWEVGRHQPSREKLQRYADAVGWEPEKSPRAVVNRGALPSAVGWQDRAACNGLSLALFFDSEREQPPAREVREERARQVCQRCPVLADCLAYATRRGEEGFWGGMTEGERKGERRRDNRQAPDQTPDATDTRHRALFEDSEELVNGQGYTVERAAERLGVKPGYLRKVRSEAQRQPAEVAS